MKISHQQGDPRSLVLLDENARFMRHETYQRLVENVKRDGVLQQWPFVWNDKKSKQKIVLSGNHRVKAAIDAGLDVIDWTECDEKLTEDQRKSIQLSHNAIVGEDDPAILKRLYDSIEAIDERLYAGLDDVQLGFLDSIPTSQLSEANLDYTMLAVMFLPAEYERAEAALHDAKKMMSGAEIWLARYDQHNKVLDAIEDARESAHVMNSATAFDVLLDVWDEHRKDLAKHWLDPKTQELRAAEKDSVPVTSLFGMTINAVQAQTVAKALRKAKDGGLDIGATLVQWAEKSME